MADRGFEIQDLLVSRKASLNIPPFMRCKDQLDPDEEDETRQVASVRILKYPYLFVFGHSNDDEFLA